MKLLSERLLIFCTIDTSRESTTVSFDFLFREDWISFRCWKVFSALKTSLHHCLTNRRVNRNTMDF
jgi:hypothetical protein